MDNLYNLKDKVAIITGARRGMGRTHALIFAEAGAKVVVSDISLDECQKVVDEIKDSGGDALAIKCDISQREEVDSMVSETIKNFGKVDVLVNNAGVADFKEFLSMTEEDWDRTININLKGYFLCSHAVAKEMAKQKSGVIVNIGSIAMGQVGIAFPNLVHYVSSKGGVAGLTQALALDLAKYNIRVNAIAPGAIETPMVDPIKADKQATEALISRLPMKRMGQPEEISSAVLFLASDAASYITGSILNVDGGWLIS
jgi:3-oxoacyl-[acyl-carrier protein] reductase